MRGLVSLVLFFGILIVLMTLRKQFSGFFGHGQAISGGTGGSGSAYQQFGFQDMRSEGFGGGHGQAISGRTGGSGSAYQEDDFTDLNEADLVYEKRKEGFRGGGGGLGGASVGGGHEGGFGGGFGGAGFGGQAISGHTAGPNNSPDLGSSANFGEDDDQEQQYRQRQQMEEAFENIGPAGAVTGKPETSDVSGPADATLNQPRTPYNLLPNLPPAPRGSISCLTARCCAETDFETRTNLTGNFLQRTNNYKREFPDSCSAPLTELNLAFYKNSLLPKA